MSKKASLSETKKVQIVILHKERVIWKEDLQKSDLLQNGCLSIHC